MPGESLKIVAGNAAGNTIALDQELVIGRSTPGLGSLGGDSEISRVHARIHRDASGQLAVEDLGSTNGTFVNGNRITGTQVLRPGDQVRVGQTTMTVEGAGGGEGATTVGAIVPPAAAAQVPPPAAVAAQPPTQQLPPQQPPYGQPPGPPPPPYGAPPGGPGGPQKKSPAPWIALGAVVLAAIIVGVLAIAGVFGGSDNKSKNAASTTPAVTTPAATQPTPSVAMPQTVPQTTDTGSSNPSDYPPGIEKTFVDSCSSGGAPRSVCQCTFAKLKSRYTFTEFVGLLNRSQGGSLPAPIQSIVRQCVNQ